MVRNFSQRRYQLHPWPPRPWLVRVFGEDLRAQIALQSQLRVLPDTYHGRGSKHDLAIPNLDRFQE